MVPGGSGSGAAAPQPAVDWRAAFISLEFFVDAANISRGRGDLILPLVFAAIVQANQAPLRNDPELHKRYGNSGEAIPDELRRPISINAVAQSLRLPFETVRRKVRSLVDGGVCVATPTGVYVPRAAIVAEEHASMQAARMARLARFHDDLQGLGLLLGDDALPRALPAELMRSVNRALSEYMLRSCDRVIELAGGVMDGFVLLGLCLVSAADALATYEAGQPLRPSPCSMRAVAARLRMPHETVRRRLLALETLGYARRRGRRWVPVAPRGHRPRLVRIAVDNELDVRRLFARLRELSQISELSRPPELSDLPQP